QKPYYPDAGIREGLRRSIDARTGEPVVERGEPQHKSGESDWRTRRGGYVDRRPGGGFGPGTGTRVEGFAIYRHWRTSDGDAGGDRGTGRHHAYLVDRASDPLATAGAAYVLGWRGYAIGGNTVGRFLL